MIEILPNGHRIKQRENILILIIVLVTILLFSWKNRNDGGLDKMELTRQYFEVLDDEDIEKLYFIYKEDFQMFGYEFNFRGKQYL